LGAYMIAGRITEAAPKIFRVAILGFALTEAVGLLALNVSFMMYFG